MIRTSQGTMGWVLVAPLTLTVAASADYFQGDDYTHVGDPFGAEDAHVDILNNIYGDIGGDFSPTGDAEATGSTWTIYENNELRLERVLDVPNNESGNSSPMNLADPSMTSGDQIWQDGIVNVRAEAKFAEFHGEFGYLPGTSGTDNFQSLFSVDPGVSGYDVDGSATFSIDGNFRWGYDVEETQLLSSKQDDNPDGQDYMVTYRVTDLDGNNPEFNNGLPVFLLFWEDFPGFDYDYNDLVIELAVIPLPAPLAMGLLGLAGVAVARRRMKKA